MLHQEIVPPDELRNSIKCFWHTRMDFGDQPSDFEIVPDGYAELVFHFGSPCAIHIQTRWQSLPSPVLMGLFNQPVRVRTENQLDVVGIRCFPWAVFELLGLPSNKNGLRLVEHPIAKLQSTLLPWIQAGKVDDALTEVGQYFLRSIREPSLDNTLVKAGAAMRNANGTLPVSQVASAAHATVRTLERKFKQAAGYSVKEVSGLMRFEQVRNHLWLHPDANLAGLAHEVGYTDQAHLSRDFKRYSGTTPAAFARQTKQAQQMVGDDLVSFV